MATIRFAITGERPLLMHNKRLADPLNPHTRAMKELTSKRKKTDEDLAKMIYVESRGAIYETPEGLVGLPVEAVWASFYEAGKAFKMGADIKRALIPDEIVVPLIIDGSKLNVEEYLAIEGNIDVRIVKVSGRSVNRSRPIVRDWSAEVEMELLTDIIDPDDLKKVVDRAGRLQGLLDFRPRYGRYSVEMEVL